ncbi:hypothetical protein NCCP2716_05780 [Sporosarcina sp. NCCP-2716]|uniref:hypothetical protein n=1 Tax=Sporosarcina sp. NCCP-2716 TaxID=2943679 RepID=UPI00203BE871|nr:hypothetical protein [Sporosarcina sp. NCCP-2716]GKV68080.1 hypothetical protein NCCP2716_05780 [Sporosarcina sp. NCCP-2716]
MSLPIVLMGIGTAALLLSIFLSARPAGSDDAEQMSISLYQETSQLKKRVKALEEELMMETGSLPTLPAGQPQDKPVHSIIVSQITALHGQGFSVDEIAARSTLPPAQVLSVLRSKGVRP